MVKKRYAMIIQYSNYITLNNPTFLISIIILILNIIFGIMFIRLYLKAMTYMSRFDLDNELQN